MKFQFKRPELFLWRLLFVVSVGMLANISIAAESKEENSPPLAIGEGVSLAAWHVERGMSLEGVGLVIDLRYPYEGVYDEVGILRNLGIRSINLPVSSRGPTTENVMRLAEVLGEYAGSHVLIHDSNGHRTAMLWGAYRLWRGDTLDSVLAELQMLYDPADLRPTLERFHDNMSAIDEDDE